MGVTNVYVEVFVPDVLSGALDAHYDPHQRQQAEHKENFAGTDACGARITRTTTGGSLVELHQPPDDEE
jgi:Zn-dependent membrane protease YugP